MAQSPLYGGGRRYDYRDRLASSLLAEGSSGAPIQSGWQGAARLAQALMGGYLANKGEEDRQNEQRQITEGLQSAFAPQFQPSPAGDGPRVGATMAPPSMQQSAQALLKSGNPELARYGAQLNMQDAAQRQSAEAERARRQWELENDPSKRFKSVGNALLDLRSPNGPSPVFTAPEAPDRQIVAIPDDKSPTGFRYGTRQEALGKPALGPQNFAIDFDPATGRPRSIMQGPGGRGQPTPSGLGQPAQNQLDTDAINAGNQIARLNSIAASFKPEYLEIVPRGQAAWASLRERMGSNLTPQQREQLTGFTSFRRDTVANLNQTIKDITGAAMSEAEAQRITQQVPNAGTGLFDGDSPTEFQSKLTGATKAAQAALMRANWARNRGVNPLQTGIPLEAVPALVEQRGAEIEREVRAQMQGGDPNAILQEVRKRLGTEFGMTR